ncbi:MAG: tetratricopeptide repeat protein [Oscillospiraceae bacterium]|jgi:tetratricopeptide (TPR) repeat protein|nr:tetratricopeptide repeat protein [Oscillospiraceae bacterium]
MARGKDIFFNEGTEFLNTLGQAFPKLMPIPVAAEIIKLGVALVGFLREKKYNKRFLQEQQKRFSVLVDKTGLNPNGETAKLINSTALITMAYAWLMETSYKATCSPQNAAELALALWGEEKPAPDSIAKTAVKRKHEQSIQLIKQYITDIYNLTKIRLYESFEPPIKAILAKIVQNEENAERRHQEVLEAIRAEAGERGAGAQARAEGKEGDELPAVTESEYTAIGYYDIALDYYDRGRYDEALHWQLKALAELEELLPIDSVELAGCYNYLGMICDGLGDYEKALEFYNKALAIYQKELGEEHPYTANTYNNIGSVYKRKGEHIKALEFYNKALAICEKAAGKENAVAARIYNNIGFVYENMGNYEKALEFYNKSIAVFEKVLGKEHPDTANTYNNIGSVYADMGDYEKALEFCNKALAIFEKGLGEEHPLTTRAYESIGIIYSRKGEYDKALEFYNKSLAIREKVLGKAHPETAISYNNIGLVYAEMGEYEKALEYYLKAYLIMRRYGEDHPRTQGYLQNLKYAYKKVHKLKSFEAWLATQLPPVAETPQKLPPSKGLNGAWHSRTARSINGEGLRIIE